MELKAAAFGPEFTWGVSTSAYQIEGGHDAEGKGPSIWDVFTEKRGTIADGHHGRVACDFYNRYDEDISLMHALGIPHFRFSISWSRLFPDGTGALNQKGADFYRRIIDRLLDANIEPWVTLYHWDLPQALEERGGWTNRDIVSWFTDYADTCGKLFGDRVKNWMILNEPVVVAGAGYFLGIHAPGHRHPTKFLKAVHHLALCQAEGGRTLRQLDPSFQIGTTFSCALIEPVNNRPRNVAAAVRADALLNRLFVEPSLGLGYPDSELPFLKRIGEYMMLGDEERLRFDFDFIGIQNYTREVVRYDLLTPYIRSKIIPAVKRNVPVSAIGWEIFPPSVLEMLRKFSSYKGIRKLIITESGIALPDRVADGDVNDHLRIEYLRQHLLQVLKARSEGIPVNGFFVWTLLDNFEWAEGYHPRFGLVHVDHDRLTRTVKRSGYWYRDLIRADQ